MEGPFQPTNPGLPATGFPDPTVYCTTRALLDRMRGPATAGSSGCSSAW